MTTPAPHNPTASHPLTPDSRHLRGGRGFTLLEILIVIAIILLLLGIGVYALPRVMGTTDRALTDSLLGQLDAINVEYKALTGSYVNINPASNTVTYRNNTQIGSNAPGSQTDNLAITDEKSYAARSIERFIATAYKAGQKDTLTAMFGNVPTDLFVDTAVTVYDPSDQSQAKTQTYDMGTPPGNGFLEVIDGWDSRIVYREPGNITVDFLPKRQVPYFASAGPDGKFGDVRQTTTDEPDYQATLDNIYSFDTPVR